MSHSYLDNYLRESEQIWMVLIRTIIPSPFPDIHTIYFLHPFDKHQFLSTTQECITLSHRSISSCAIKSAKPQDTPGRPPFTVSWIGKNNESSFTLSGAKKYKQILCNFHLFCNNEYFDTGGTVLVAIWFLSALCHYYKLIDIYQQKAMQSYCKNNTKLNNKKQHRRKIFFSTSIMKNYKLPS